MTELRRAAITEDDVRRIAALAGLPISDERVKVVANELRGMMSLADSLYELDTSNVDPELAWDASWD